MANFVDLVLVKHQNSDKKLLFVAPKFSCLKENDIVVVDTKHGNSLAYVIDSYTIDINSEEFDFIKKSLDIQEFKRVLFKCKKLDWEKEDI